MFVNPQHHGKIGSSHSVNIDLLFDDDEKEMASYTSRRRYRTLAYSYQLKSWKVAAKSHAVLIESREGYQKVKLRNIASIIASTDLFILQSCLIAFVHSFNLIPYIALKFLSNCTCKIKNFGIYFDHVGIELAIPLVYCTW